jgi:hypothetical protein
MPFWFPFPFFTGWEKLKELDKQEIATFWAILKNQN